ncbi:MAG: serine/threonine-protein kinase [Planctomycetota bacterium]
MAKSRIGPFALEAPLAPAIREGQVFRGVHLEQKKLAALRVFKIPMGMTPESRQEYAQQLEALKNLRHEGIVRCYGGGFDTRSAYLAYQLVEGESLEALVERRGRLPWDTALEFARQITEALQYAHEREWFHGRLKPDKVIVDRSGVAKVSDWRRDAISYALGQRKPSVEQLQFSAPECVSGENIGVKSDLYSIGALLYFMLTGDPPFRESDAKQLKLAIVKQAAPDVGALVLDCPVWLSAIVGQLLSKDPQQRPFSTTALLLAFKEAEKREQEGVGVLQHATAGFSPLQLQQTNRAEAEKVLGIKKKKRKKKQAESSFFDQTWVLLLGFAAAIFGVVWFLLPYSEATLRDKAQALLPPTSERWQDWNDARDDFMLQLVERFPDGANANWATEKIAWVDARETLRRLERENRLNRKSKWVDAERQYWNAWEFEEFGDLFSAREKYRAILKLYRESEEAADICFLSREGLERIREKGQVLSVLQEFVTQRLEGAQAEYDIANLVEAREIWESIVELYADNPLLEEQVEQAKDRLLELGNR